MKDEYRHNIIKNAVNNEQLRRQHPSPWCTMVRGLPTAWTTTRSLLVASRVMAIPKTPTNSDSTQPRAAHQEGVAMQCHQCRYVALGLYSDISSFETNTSGFVPHTYKPPPQPCSHPTNHGYDQLHPCVNTRRPSMRSASASENHPQTSEVTQMKQQHQ